MQILTLEEVKVGDRVRVWQGYIEREGHWALEVLGQLGEEELHFATAKYPLEEELLLTGDYELVQAEHGLDGIVVAKTDNNRVCWCVADKGMFATDRTVKFVVYNGEVRKY